MIDRHRDQTKTAPNTPAVALHSTLAVKGALERELLPTFLRDGGHRLDVTFAPTAVLLGRITDGARPDVVVATATGLADLERLGVLDSGSVRPVAAVGVGLAVVSGGTRPDISTVDAFLDALLTARSVAYSRTGASGHYFSDLLARFGVADAVNRNATIVDQGFTADAVADGRADLAVQQLSELLLVDGVDVVGPLPEEIQHRTEFAIGTLSTDALGRPHHPGTADLLVVLTSPAARQCYRTAGLETTADI